MKPKPRRAAKASDENLRKIFTIPESEDSTLSRIEAEISRNIDGFLKTHVIAGDAEPAELEASFLDTRIPDDPVFVSEQADFLLKKVVAQSVQVSSPYFIGHMTSALPYFMFPLAKIMMALNQNLVKIETSKAFTPLERQVIGMLHRLFYNFDEDFYDKHTHDRVHSLGVFCSGGTVANITGMWAARNQMLGPQGDFPGVQRAGLASALVHYGYRGLRVFVSSRAHYSMRKAADLLGIGLDNVVSVPTTKDFKISIDALEEAIELTKKQGYGVLAIVGVAGTTETGHVDPLRQLSSIAQREGCHFHVDAAWGGPTIFSRSHKHLLDGIELADSITIDAHKQLYVPVGAGIALFRNLKALDAIEQSADYVIRKGSRDIGKHTLEGSRSGMALLVHSALRIIGKRGFELLIDRGMSTAKAFAAKIAKLPDFELISSPELNLLTYRFVPGPLKDLLRADADSAPAINLILNNLTVEIQRLQRTAGRTFVSRTTLQPTRYPGQDITVFRVVLANPLTDARVLDEVLAEQRKHAFHALNSGIACDLEKVSGIRIDASE